MEVALEEDLGVDMVVVVASGAATGVATTAAMGVATEDGMAEDSGDVGTDTLVGVDSGAATVTGVVVGTISREEGLDVGVKGLGRGFKVVFRVGILAYKCLLLYFL